MSVSRVVALFTPVFAALAGYVSLQVAQLPGAPALDPTQLTVVFVAGVASATGAAVKWLHGRSAHERQAAGHVFETERYPMYAGEPEPAPEPESDDVKSDAHDPDDVKAARTLLGLVGMEAELARLRIAVGAHDERIENLEVPHAAGSTAHHPV